MTAEVRGPCAGCGRECTGTHIAGTVYTFSCEDCDREINDGFAALIDRITRGDRL